MMKHKCNRFLVVFILILSLLLPSTGLTALGMSPSTSNGDTPSAWAHADVDGAINAGLVPQTIRSKYTQATTRAEFCSLAVTLYETALGVITNRYYFDDTNDANVENAAAIGVVYGTGGNKFSPNNALTREQAATMLSRLAYALGTPLRTQSADFADNWNMSSWATEAIGQMQASGIMQGSNNMFSPKSSYTREQSIVTILRLFKVINSKLSVNPVPFTWLGKTPQELTDLVGGLNESMWFSGYRYRFGDYWFGFDKESPYVPVGKSFVLWCEFSEIVNGLSGNTSKADLDKLFGQLGQFYEDQSGEGFFDYGYLHYTYQGFSISVDCKPGFIVEENAFTEIVLQS